MTKESESSGNEAMKDLRSLVLLRGICLAIVGVVFLIFPMSTLNVMLVIMGLWWLIDGIITIVKSVKGRKQHDVWRWGIFTGILGAIAGIIVLANPELSTILSTSLLAWFLGISAFIYGISGIVTGIRLRKEIKGEWSMIIGGVFSILFGSLLIGSPFVSVLTIITIIGVVSLIGGAAFILVAYSIKKKVNKNGE